MRWQDYLILSFLVAGYLFWRTQQGKTKQTASSKKELTRKEEAAVAFLGERGYRLAEVRPSVPITLHFGNRGTSFDHEGNLLVTKNGKYYLVTFKDKNSRVNTGAFRREMLLEYLLFKPAAIILFDSDLGKYREVKFTIHTTILEKRSLMTILLVFLILAGVVFLINLFNVRGLL